MNISDSLLACYTFGDLMERLVAVEGRRGWQWELPTIANLRTEAKRYFSLHPIYLSWPSLATEAIQYALDLHESHLCHHFGASRFEYDAVLSHPMALMIARETLREDLEVSYMTAEGPCWPSTKL